MSALATRSPDPRVGEVHGEVVHGDRRAAERAAAALAQQARRAEARDREASVGRACAALQAEFDAALAARSLGDGCGVRFFVCGSAPGDSYVPRAAPTRGSVLADLQVTPEEAGRLLDLLIAGGFVRPSGGPSTGGQGP